MTYLGNHTNAVQKGLNLGVGLFIVSEAFFFLAIFWAFFHSAISPSVELGAQWPPLGIQAVNPFELPLLNTVLLLSSGVTITYAHHSLIQSNRKGALYGTVATIILAVIFTFFQGVEYTVSSFTISDSVYGSCFYFGTGFHGLIKKTETTTKPFSYTISNTKLCPHWVTGFCDAESSFSLRIAKNSTRKSGWRVSPIFIIELDSKDIVLLKRIQEFFGVGVVSIRNNGMAVYNVQSFSDITHAIIPHFKNYPLLTQKKADFILFSDAVQLLNEKAQSSSEGLQKIINIRASMNKGLSELLKESFPNTVPVTRPLINTELINHPNWLVGFVDGEGCFYVKITNNSSKLGGQVSLVFSLTQHSRDEILFNTILKYLGCGAIEKVSTRPNEVKYVIYKFGGICNNLIPLFQKYPLQGVKSLNFSDFCKVANLMINKVHLTKEGIEEVKLIKSQMNTGRFKK